MPYDIRDPAQRALAAKRIVSESAGPDPLDERDPLARAVMGGRASVRLQIPVRSIAETRRMLRVVLAELTEVAASLDRASETDRTLLCGAQRRINLLNKKINCYRSGGRDWQ